MEHYKNCIRNIDVCKYIRQFDDDEDTIIDEMPQNQMAVPECQPNYPVSDGETEVRQNPI